MVEEEYEGIGGQYYTYMYNMFFPMTGCCYLAYARSFQRVMWWGWDRFNSNFIQMEPVEIYIYNNKTNIRVSSLYLCISIV